MHEGNPLAPATAWLNSIAHPAGGFNKSEPGDKGTEIIERGDMRFRVTVENITGEEDE